MRSRAMADLPAGTNSLSPSTNARDWLRQASSQSRPKVTLASMADCVSCAFTPKTAQHELPRRSSPRVYTGPKERSRSAAVLSRPGVKSGKLRSSTRPSSRW